MGILYVVPTPVGNMEDMTYRAVRILKEADVVLAEDTRTSGILLKHFDIHNHLLSHHKFNEHGTSAAIVERLLAGQTVALISDAGTPGISDPGFFLVREAVRAGIEVQTLPVTTLRGVEVRGNAATELSVPMPGMLVLSKPKGITTGAIFRLRDGQVEFATDLNPSTAGERLLLQPGQYELVLHPQNATKYDKVQTKRFVIESSQTTKIQF